ncbi:MAG TPA: transposase [Streptosporangiaceae bacterium]|jgi:IS605 OrfB family transposase
MMANVKLVAQVKLLPSPEQAADMKATLRACNDAANRVSAVAFGMTSRRNYDVRKRAYKEVRSRGIGSQAAQHVIKKTCDAYATLKANIRAGNLGDPGSRRRMRAESRPITFRADAAQPYDQRNLSFALDARTVSLWTVAGRLKDLSFTGSPAQLEQLATHKPRESDLIYRDGIWFLAVTIDVPDPDLREPVGWLGVDLGIVNIATISDGQRMAGRRLNRYRRRQLALRRKLQAKKTKSAKRLLKRQRRREARFAADTNHCIAKTIVTTAERTGRGIALEDLTGIRARVRLRKDQRSSLHSWAFAQLGQFIAYKARRAGVPVTYVDPAYTSQQCSECSYTDRSNRAGQATFVCRACGVTMHADLNGSRNIALRADAAWQAGRQSSVPEPVKNRFWTQPDP